MSRLSPLAVHASPCDAIVAISRLARRISQQLPDPVATFSILGYDPATGEVGGAVQSRVFSVGNGVLWARRTSGIVATQAIVDVSYGPQGAGAAARGHDARRRSSSAICGSDPDPGSGQTGRSRAGSSR